MLWTLHILLISWKNFWADQNNSQIKFEFSLLGFVVREKPENLEKTLYGMNLILKEMTLNQSEMEEHYAQGKQEAQV